MADKPEFWIDDKGYVYRIEDKGAGPIYWIKDNYIYLIPKQG
jgi:hypothetical protein